MNLPFSCKRFPEQLDLAPMRSASIIAIDGDSGAGKSELADELCRKLNGTHIEIDRFLSGNGARYLEQLDKPGLIDRIESSLNSPIILDGILMLDLLDAVGKKADHFVFGICLPPGGREIDRYLPANADLPKNKITRELVIYYRNRSPWLKADQTYELRCGITRTRPQST